MKKWSWRLYLVGVHAALAIAVGMFVWVRYFDRGLPVHVEWIGGFDGMPASQAGPLRSGTPVKQDFAYIRIDGDAIASLSFEDRRLVMMSFAWPGDDTQWTMTETNSLIMQPYFVDIDQYAGLPTITGGDRDGDRMIDFERHALPVGSRFYRRERQLRYDLGVEALGTRHVLYDRRGAVAARVTDDPAKSAVTVEYIEDGTPVRTESIERDAYDLDAISDAIWDRDAPGD